MPPLVAAMPLDPAIERRYASLTNELQLAGRRRQWITISGVLALCTVLIVGLVLWQLERTKANDLRLAADSMRKMLDENRLEDAQAFVTQITSSKPNVAKTRAIHIADRRAFWKGRCRKDRAAAFETYIAEADNEDPSKIDVSALNRAEKIAQTDSDSPRCFESKRGGNNGNRNRNAKTLRTYEQHLSQSNAH